MYAFNPDFKIRSSLGGGFRAPSFIELYSDFPMPIPGMPLKVIGNPDLKPEKSIGGNYVRRESSLRTKLPHAHYS